MNDKTYFIIDFDSTFVRIEALDRLAEIALDKHPQKLKRIKAVETITAQGMRGEVSFDVSLEKRLKLFSATKKDIDTLVRVLKKNITPSMIRNKEFFRTYRDVIYIISGGFKEYIAPVFEPFGIDPSHILANEFRFDRREKVIGFDTNNLLSKERGKVKQIKKLKLEGTIYVVGDGFTDLQIKNEGSANKFFVFCENVKRDSVSVHADYILPNFDEFLYLFDLPRAYSYPKNRIKVLLLERIHERAAEKFTHEGFSVEVIPQALGERELAEKLKDVSVLGIRSKTQITREALKSARRLLAVGAFCIGTNQIDVGACAQKGIAVFNAPYSNTRSVVELVLGEIIMLARKTFEKSRKMHEGIWDKSLDGCFEIRGKTLGIVGYGNIGSQLSVVAEMLGMNVRYFDVGEKLALGNAKKCSTLPEVLHTSDIVTVHVDGRASNANLIGEKEFKSMKEGVLFLNLSRGSVVDMNALVRNLKSGKIRGAAIDVFPHEPAEIRDTFSNELLGMHQAILTPHVGGNTIEAQQNIGDFVAERIIQFVNTGSTSLSVNFPHVDLPPFKDAHRILHIHSNVPGVLAQINTAFAIGSVNILGQYLATSEAVGIVITDIEKNHDPKIIELLRRIPETIKLRVLY